MKLSKAVSLRIEELIKLNKITQYQVYRLTGVPQSTISTIISQKDKTCKVLTIAQIAAAFKMGVKEFFDSELFTYENLEVE